MSGCMSCGHGRCVSGSWVYCKEKSLMMYLSSSCEKYIDGLTLSEKIKRNQAFDLLLQHPAKSRKRG